MKTNKYLVTAFGALALIAFNACTTEELVEPSVSNGSETQNEPAEMTGEVIVKFDPSVSELLDERGLAQTRSGAPATRSGIYSVDEVLDMLGDCQLERIFPVDARYEERSRQAGMHLWYVVRFSDKYSVDEVINRLSVLGEVQTATPNRTIKRAYRADRKPIPFPKAALKAPATRAEGENGYIYNDPLLKWEWHMVNRGYKDHFIIGQDEDAEAAKKKFREGADVNCEPIWEDQEKYTTGDPSIVVAVLDEGIYWRHPDLINNMWENEDEPYYKEGSEMIASHEDLDKNGYAGDHYGYNFINETGVISCDNSADTGHGTHVAGVIAARNNNGIGISSIAGGTEANPGVKVMSCQIFSGNSTSNTIALARAIKYAADNGAVILQCSWGYTSGTANGYDNVPGFATQEEWEVGCPLEKIALDYFVHNAGSPNGPIEGGIPIFASGNEYAPSAGYPGAADYCVSVNSIAADFTISTFSNYGPGSNISAPGGDQDYYFDFVDDRDDAEKDPSTPEYTAPRGAVGCVLSTLPPQVSDDTEYGYMEGTSMACPHVSGVAALGLSYAVKLRKHFTAAEFRKLLVNSITQIDEFQSGNKSYYHYVSDLGKTYPRIIPLSQYSGKVGGLVNAKLLLDAIAGKSAGSQLSFPNIYLGIGEENLVRENPARYFVNGETLTYTIQVDDPSIASAQIEEKSGLAVFTGLKLGATSASIVASNGETHSFNITVRKSANGNGWL